MKPETQGKLMVAMLVSLLAFGFGTGTILLTGQYQTSNPTTSFNTTKQSDLPVIPNSNQNKVDTTTPSTPSTSNNPSTPSTPTDSDSGQSNQNNNPGSSNNTTRN